MVGWRRNIDIGTHTTHPVIDIGTLEFVVAHKSRQPLVEIPPHLWKDGPVRSCPLLGGPTQPIRHKLTNQSQPLRASEAVVVQHSPVIKKQLK